MDEIDQNSGIMTAMKRAFEKYEREVLPKNAPRTQKDKRAHLSRLRRSFGHMEPDQITTPMVQSYVERRSKTSKNQARQEVSTLSQVMRYAKVWGYLKGANPVTGIIRPESKPRERLPSLAELAVLQHHSTPFIAAYIDLKLETGLRQQDLLALRMSKHITDDGIRIRTGKTGIGIFVPMTDRLKDAIARLRACNRVQTDFLMTSRDGNQLSKDSFGTRWRSSMNKALNAPENRLDESFHEHDIRATHATMIEEHLGLEAASHNLGHDSTRTTKDYIRNRGFRKTIPLSHATVNQS